MTEHMWADGNDLLITIEGPGGVVYRQTLPVAALTAAFAGEEIIRYTFDWTEEDDSITRGAARLVLQRLTDPRAEVQPATPAEATVSAEVDEAIESAQKLDEWKQRIGQDLGEDAGGARIVVAHSIAGHPSVTAVTPPSDGHQDEMPVGPPSELFRQSGGAVGLPYGLERGSGSPRLSDGPDWLVDGPGCTPAAVAPVPCEVPGCGKLPAEHVGWELGHQYTTQTPAHEVHDEGPARCQKCRQIFDESDARFDGLAQYRVSPFCRRCVDRCQGTEIADHWCEVDQHWEDQQK